MAPRRDSLVYWVIGGVLFVLVCCLGLTLAAAGVLLVTPGSIPTPRVLVEPSLAAEATEVSPSITAHPFPTEAGQQGEGAYETLALLSSIEVPTADPVLLTGRLKGIGDIPRVLAEDADPVPVGTQRVFWVTNTDIRDHFQIEAELAYVGDHVYFWIGRGVEYDLEDVESIVEEFENQAYPTNRMFFGSEWLPGVDGDPRLYILYAKGLGDSVAGYYSEADEYSQLVNEYSNGHEMFYLNADSLPLDRSYADGVLAHEFVHMIQWNLDRNEDTWMDEGFAELGAMLNGSQIGGFDLVFAQSPDLTLSYWPIDPQATTAHYGQSFLFLAYFLERFGSEATQALVRNPSNGLASIDQTLAELGITDPASGELITADDFFRDWAVALYLQDPDVGDGRYVITPGSPSAVTTERVVDCPLEEQTRQVSQYGIDMIGVLCPGDFTLVFDGETLVKVVPADPHSGDYAFWSNRGDESDMALTRGFDFRAVSAPIVFDYWVWYEIEESYDYLYLEASRDGGRSWQILTTPSGTAENPTGHSYGWAYNGLSGGGVEADWIHEAVDLSEFAGEEVLLRFEYVTDGAVNGEGLLLDDVAIEAIGYAEGFDDDDGGWEADGFVRLFNSLPQTYRLVLVQERGSEVFVDEIRLDDERHAEVPINLRGGDEATLVVMASTRYSWQPASYTYRIEG